MFPKRPTAHNAPETSPAPNDGMDIKKVPYNQDEKN